MELSNIGDLLEGLSTYQEVTNSTYSAIVSRIDNEGGIWVNLAGSNIETPITGSSSEIEAGDVVTVEWRNNKLYIAGNSTNPSAGVVRVEAVERATAQARTAADSAVADAAIARTAAEQAQADADTAHQAAGSAQESAESAMASATTAIDQLAIVENVVGVLDLLQQNGDYELTQDTAIQEDKWYFTRSGTGTDEDPYIYTVVPNPEGDPSSEGWYELVGIDEAIQNYVSSHLAVDNRGLWLQTEETGTRILLSTTDGVVLYGQTGNIVGKYGETAQIGDTDGFHLEVSGTEIGFYQEAQKVAYISNNQLYITQSVVLQQMDVGSPEDGLGQWSWKVHENGLSPNQNNLCLKWIG